MARALSHLFSLIRGSVGGLTYFSNQFHQICMRQRTAPVQPNTPYQAGVKTAFDLSDATWNALPALSRELWESYAQTCTYPGPAGDYTVPGRQLFIGTLVLAQYLNGFFPETIVPSVDPPLEAGWYNPGNFKDRIYDGGTQGISLTLTTPPGPFSSIVVDSSIGFSPSRLRYKGPWISNRKHFQQLPQNAIHNVTIDLPLAMVGMTVFSRSKVFTAALFGTDPIPHRMAFPVILRHIVTVDPGNGDGNDSPTGSKAKKVTNKKKAIIA